MTCSEKVRFHEFQPPDVGARKTRRRYSADYVLRGSPTQRRQPRAQKNKDGRQEDYAFRGRGRQSRDSLPMYSSVMRDGGVGSGCAAERSVPTAGG